MQQNRFHTRFADTIFEGDENCCIFSHSVYRRLFLYEKQNFKKKKNRYKNVELPSCTTREIICWDADRHTDSWCIFREKGRIVIAYKFNN